MSHNTIHEGLSLPGKNIDDVISSDKFQNLEPDEQLYQSTVAGSLKGVQIALNRGANIYYRNDELLRQSVRSGNPDVVELILTTGDVDVNGSRGSALHLAIFSGYTEIVKLLLEYGADISIGNYHSLKIAKGYKQLEILDILNDWNDKLNSTMNEEETYAKHIPESLNEWNDNKNIKIAAGLVVIQDNKILLVHPTNSLWWKTYSIPKGEVEKNEGYLEAAIRETYEETGLKIHKNEVSKENSGVINYIDDKGNIYKKVYYFIVHLNYKVDKDMFKLQLEEVDWVGFVSKPDAEKKIFGRFKLLLNLLN